MMKKWAVWWASVVLVIAIVMAGCSPAPEPAPAASEPVSGDAPAQAVSGRCGDPSRLSDTISFYNWSDYIDEAVLDAFEDECGVEVIYDTFASNEDLLAKLQGGATGYDLIVPSDYMVSIMIQLNMLHELNHENIPNLANLSPEFIDPPFDPGNKYSVAYQWGMAGIGYNPAEFGDGAPDSWAVFFDPAQAQKYAGRFSLLNDGRETIGAALKYLGYSMNSTDPAQLEEAKQVILAVKPYIATFDSETFSDLLVSGDTVLGHAWNGNIYQAVFENENVDLAFAVPKEGATIFTDNLAIPATAPNPYTAEVLINFLLDAEIGAQITNFTYYPSPNEASLPYILDEIKNDPGIYPPEEVRAKLEFISDVGEATQLYERLWTEIKAE